MNDDIQPLDPRESDVPDPRESDIPVADTLTIPSGSAPTPPAPASETKPPVSGATKALGGCFGCLGLLTAITIVLTGVAGVFAANLMRQPVVRATSTQTFMVTDNPQLSIDSSASDVHIQTGATDRVIVQIDKSERSFSHDQAQHDLDDWKVNVTQTGNTVSVTTDDDINGLHLVFWAFRQMDITITVPPIIDIDAASSAGKLTISGVTGQLTSHNSAGSTELHDMTITGTSRVTNSAGSTSFTGTMVDDATLTVENSAGSTSINTGLATHNTLDIQNSAGSVTLTIPSTPASHIDATTSAGSINNDGLGFSTVSRETNTEVHGDTGADPTNTIHVRASAGSITLRARP